MAGAIGILLNSLGIKLDPEQIAKDYEQLKKDIALWGKAVIDLKAQFDRVEAQNTEILAILKKENPNAAE